MVGKKQIEEVITALSMLGEETGVPKNVKSKIQEIMSNLKNKEDLSITINKALSDLEEVAEDANMQSYTRTQMLNVISLLEKLA
jgi:uncharacterized protein (UPF0147 family)